MAQLDRITHNPAIMGGKACIRGMRVTVGMILGCALTWLVAGPGVDLGALTSHNQYFAVSGIIHPRLTLLSVALPPLLALLFALLAGIWPMCMIVRQRPAEVLRSI